ncbi:Protein EFR3-like protein A [Plecturocebus cupreus]
MFPEDPKDGLVKADMEKLTFYAVSAPEKLDRIGSYLAERLSRDVVRHRSGYVLIAMEALDQLLIACRSQSIKPFAELSSYGGKAAGIGGTKASMIQKYERRYELLELGIFKVWFAKQLPMNFGPPFGNLSIWAQYSHYVIQEILGHLEARKKDAPWVRAGIIQVLLEAVTIAAKGSIGPTVLEVFNTLLKHLRLRVEFEEDDLQGASVGCGNLNTSSKDNDEKIVQNAIIQTIGFFGSSLPDYQRSEIMMFIMEESTCFWNIYSYFGYQSTRGFRNQEDSDNVAEIFAYDSLTMSHRLDCSGMACCNLSLPGSNDSPASASGVAGNTGAH